jgi:hypothetical protein
MLITSQEEILLSRLKMVDQLKNGTSISLLEPSEVDQSTNPSISTTPVNPTTCNTTALAPTGGRCSSTKVNHLSILKLRRSFPSRTSRMKKLNQFG